jgi:hypothetical protein
MPRSPAPGGAYSNINRIRSFQIPRIRCGPVRVGDRRLLPGGAPTRRWPICGHRGVGEARIGKRQGPGEWTWRKGNDVSASLVTDDSAVVRALAT